ncbi:putative major facilitator superfamily transporter [Nemania sp. FL0031]|nr:putative major facilitator superfamily transporter [Nemania sp. FL0031]
MPEHSSSPPTERTRLIDSDERATQEDRPVQDTGRQTHTHYSAFGRGEKRLIVFLISTAGFFSPFSAFIYFPAIPLIAPSLGVTIQLVNLTVTMYLIVQGIVPSIVGDLSENLGRRPIYLGILTIYVAANIGLGLQNSYGALLALRMLQSAGSSGTIALAYGVIADIAPPHERGSYVGITHVGFNMATSLGPVLGGLLASKVGWRSIFWLLASISGSLLLLMLASLPETSRGLVGDGSIRATGINQSLYDRLFRKDRPDAGHMMQRPPLKLPNLSPCFAIILQKETAIIILSNAIFYMKFSCVQASLAPLLQDRYNLSTMQVGFCYLAFGSATSLASYGVGRIADYDYTQCAVAHNLPIDRVRGDNMRNFPIEKARLRTIWLYIIVSATATLVYGWTLEYHLPLAVSLTMQFFIGLAVTGTFNVFGTLVTDLHADRAATASAAVSITRCLIAAAGVSVLQLGLEALGSGWMFTIIAGLCFATMPMLWVVRQKGWEWRLEKESSAEDD